MKQRAKRRARYKAKHRDKDMGKDHKANLGHSHRRVEIWGYGHERGFFGQKFGRGDGRI